MTAAILPSCAAAKVFLHHREGRNVQAPVRFGSRSHHAGIYRRRVALPNDAWGRGRIRAFYKPIGFSDSVFWCFALIGIVARRVFWFALLFAGRADLFAHGLVAVPRLEAKEPEPGTRVSTPQKN